jgi:hypothetical protein
MGVFKPPIFFPRRLPARTDDVDFFNLVSLADPRQIVYIWFKQQPVLVARAVVILH